MLSIRGCPGGAKVNVGQDVAGHSTQGTSWWGGWRQGGVWAVGSWVIPCRGCPGRAAGTEAGMDWGSGVFNVVGVLLGWPEPKLACVGALCIRGTLATPSEAKVVQAWSVLGCFVPVSPWCDGWRCSEH